MKYILLVFILLFIVPFKAQAAATTAISLIPSSITSVQGQSFTSDVSLSTGSNKLISIDVVIHFDPQIIRATDVVLGTFFPTANVIQERIDNTLGTVTYSVYTTKENATSGIGTLATIHWSSVSVGNSPIAFDVNQTIVYAAGEGNTLSSRQDSTVTVSQQPNPPTPTPTNTSSQQPTPTQTSVIPTTPPAIQPTSPSSSYTISTPTPTRAQPTPTPTPKSFIASIVDAFTQSRDDQIDEFSDTVVYPTEYAEGANPTPAVPLPASSSLRRVVVLIKNEEKQVLASARVVFENEKLEKITNSDGLATFENVKIGRHILAIYPSKLAKIYKQIEVLEANQTQLFEIVIPSPPSFGKVLLVIVPLFVLIAISIVFLFRNKIFGKFWTPQKPPETLK